jgi:membrane-bound serine protease (ClpP class)
MGAVAAVLAPSRVAAAADLARASDGTEDAEIVVMRLAGTVQPASLRYVERGIGLAAGRRAPLVILELDTPGGTLVSLRSMTTAITSSDAPVAVFVTPAGARAASAGFFLMLAADVAAMAPGTNAGAAHPVAIGDRRAGERGPDRDGAPEHTEPAIAKAVEDAAALARSLASARGRSVEHAEQAVKQSRSYSAGEALRHDLADVMAEDRSALLSKLDGWKIQRFDGRSETLRLTGVAVAEVEPTIAERVLMVIADPQVAYLLLMLGMFGLMVELLHPGGIVPGVAGGISVLLGFYAFSVLPVNWAGILLIAVGIGLLVVEAFVTSYGLMTLAGLASVVLGSLILVDAPMPGGGLGVGVVLPTVAVLGMASALLISRVWRLHRAPPSTGLEAMIGETGDLTGEIAEGRGEGKVFVHGEYWAAISDGPLPRGARVRVQRVEGSRLRVAPADSVGR